MLNLFYINKAQYLEALTSYHLTFTLYFPPQFRRIFNKRSSFKAKYKLC